VDSLFFNPNYPSQISGVQWGNIPVIILWWLVLIPLLKRGKRYLPKYALQFTLCFAFALSLLMTYARLLDSYGYCNGDPAYVCRPLSFFQAVIEVGSLSVAFSMFAFLVIGFALVLAFCRNQLRAFFYSRKPALDAQNRTYVSEDNRDDVSEKSVFATPSGREASVQPDEEELKAHLAAVLNEFVEATQAIYSVCPDEESVPEWIAPMLALARQADDLIFNLSKSVSSAHDLGIDDISS
jgi:hypothetical protein